MHIVKDYLVVWAPSTWGKLYVCDQDQLIGSSCHTEDSEKNLTSYWCMVRNLTQWIAVCSSLRHHVLISLDDNSSTLDTSNRLPIRTVVLSRGVLASVLSSWHKLKLFGKKRTSNKKMSSPHIDWQACETFSWLMIDMVCILPTLFLIS